ncbi:low-density lipoprotein receptor-like isoform X2 [Procambarus clarkii]|uniref:low-density lipoprotein receptor isoform X2 n=1 Tax=Procambarus clarkii TaxID=6728 RepID=UPI003742438A
MKTMRRTEGLLVGLLFLLVPVLSTDLVAVYKHDILLLRDVDKITPELPLQWNKHVLPLPKGMSYPVGLTQDIENNRLFVADAVHEDTKIFSLTLDSDFNVKAMHSVLKNSSLIVMEGMSYDPVSHQLYWTDSTNHGIFKTLIPSELKETNSLEPKLLERHGNVTGPHGVTVDYCNQLLYWSNINKLGRVPSTIQMVDLSENIHKIIQQDNENNIYYQGLTYDVTRGALIWGETIGNNYTESNCRIVSTPTREMEYHELLNLTNCFPFSLAVDEEYIYWADWARQGIMRASLNNRSDVVKLVHTPAIKTAFGWHHGAYGLSLLSNPAKKFTMDLCKGEKSFQGKLDMKAQEPEIKNPVTKPPHLESATEEITKETSVSSVLTVSRLKDSLQGETEMTTDQIVMKNDSESVQLGTEEETPHSFATSLQENKMMVQAEMRNETKLLIIIMVLAVFCALFMFSTVFLFVKYFCKRSPERCKPSSPTAINHKQVPAQLIRQVKRFGPKKRYGSGNKSGFIGTSPCPELSSSDGVSINIEDCCQMTMCETPCYTSVKREGKGYKAAEKHNRYEDKRGLLDDCEDI